MKKRFFYFFTALTIISFCGCTNKKNTTISTTSIQETNAETISTLLENQNTEDLSSTASDDMDQYNYQGFITPDKVKEDDLCGFYTLYSDGSMDMYPTGEVLIWNTQYMTYGVDAFPEDLIMFNYDVKRCNEQKRKEGRLVLFWPYDVGVTKELFKVEESGYSLFRTAEDYSLEGLFKYQDNVHDEYGFNMIRPWKTAKSFSNVLTYSTINGIPAEDYDFPSADISDGRHYVSFPPDQTYTIGIIEGTSVVEEEYETDHMYFLHEDESSDFKLTPTTDGYAIFDFSDTEPGEYVCTVTRFDTDRKRTKVITTYINIE